MSNKFATGPFQVPLFATGGIPADLNINVLNVILKNHSDEERTVQVKVEKCLTAVFPATSTEEELLSETVELNKGECTVLQVSILPNDILRVEVQGEIEEDLEKMEICVTGGNSLNPGDGFIQFAEATMFFRHGNFLKSG
ncbi:hypothetical protein RB620_21610 [Paenibacillus sp. LHD-117]|uniref:hypothetical protein n=1 Tax=Paenibacillus sp. LHD-117 TaxID=3071412 RepID=UPI0027E00695|nr:hypothetical protein [Paenibacillus sp. LHD-117]MDQ6422031.1 hypothetical protein [Paenibacillus sp. LHD-117]